MLTKIFFATDVHGSERCFKKFINAGKFYKVDTLILGGDLTGKMIVPVVEQPEGTYSFEFLGHDMKVKTREELEEFEERIRNIGLYPYLTDQEEYKKLDTNPSMRDELFSQLMVKRIKRWMKIAEERLKGTAIRAYITGGNDDSFCIDPILKDTECFIDAEDKVVSIDGHHEMISTGYANITPWNCPRDTPEEELAAKIETMCTLVKNMRNCIFNFHCPPINSGLDTCPKLDTTTSPPTVIEKEGQVVMSGCGSSAIRAAIEKHQPLLGLHGHIHESRGYTKIGRTLCINPGSEYGEGILRGIIIALDERKVKTFQLTSG